MNFSNEQLNAILKQSSLKADHEFEAPPVCLEINGEYGNQIFATLGNFSTILARPKVGKTTFAAIMIVSLLTGKTLIRFHPQLPPNTKILWIDTEQGKPECVRTIRLISKMVYGDEKKHPDNLVFLSLRPFSQAQRVQITEYAINHVQNLTFVIIDGIRDFVASINDEKESNFIADKLLKWTQEKNIHILTILHQNKGDANARGHLGTELMNKAETVAKLSRDEIGGNRTTTVEPEFTRHKDFEKFSYSLDEYGNLFETETKADYQPKNPKASELTHSEIAEILRGVYSNGESYPFGKLQKKIHEICNSPGMFSEFGMNKCSDLIKRLKNERFIYQKEGSVEYTNNTPL